MCLDPYAEGYFHDMAVDQIRLELLDEQPELWQLEPEEVNKIAKIELKRRQADSDELRKTL